MVKAMSMLYAHDFILCLVSISFPFFLFLLYFLCPLPSLSHYTPSNTDLFPGKKFLNSSACACLHLSTVLIKVFRITHFQTARQRWCWEWIWTLSTASPGKGPPLIKGEGQTLPMWQCKWRLPSSSTTKGFWLFWFHFSLSVQDRFRFVWYRIRWKG